MTAFVPAVMNAVRHNLPDRQSQGSQSTSDDGTPGKFETRLDSLKEKWHFPISQERPVPSNVKWQEPPVSDKFQPNRNRSDVKADASSVSQTKPSPVAPALGHSKKEGDDQALTSGDIRIALLNSPPPAVTQATRERKGE